LSPGQGRQIELLTGRRVLDRSELILDIFATRARSREAKLQVELAQLQYLLPRLRRMWSHLSRIRGGIGLRGPGETQLETDRRMIGRRIADLRRALDRVVKSRAVQRRSRRGEFRAALVGYTNAGKSSLVSGLSGADLLVADRLFSTLDSTTRVIELGDGHRALLTDTVGFIRKLPHHLVASFRSTLDEAREADVVMHVIDSSVPGWRERREVVDGVLAEMGIEQGQERRLLVFNKVDRLTHAEEAELRSRVAMTGDPTPAIFVSAHDPGSLRELNHELLARVSAGHELVAFRVPVSDGAALATIYRESEVMALRQEAEWVYLCGRVPRHALGRLGRTDLDFRRVAGNKCTDATLGTGTGGVQKG